jgi:hypothetical protein
MRFALLFLFLLFLRPTLHADFTSACDAYEAGKYAAAKKEYTTLLDGGISPELAFNLGCTEVKLGNNGAGALWFQRTLLLSPHHKESLQNLRYLKRKGGTVVFDDSPSDDYARWLRPVTWQLVFWACLWALVLAAATLIFLRPKRLWPWITGLSLAFVCTIAAASGWLIRSKQQPPQTLSVVMSEDLSVLNAPADSADPLISINAGSLVHVLEERDKWSYLELPGETGTRGWLKTAALEKLWPYSPALVE